MTPVEGGRAVPSSSIMSKHVHAHAPALRRPAARMLALPWRRVAWTQGCLPYVLCTPAPCLP